MQNLKKKQASHLIEDKKEQAENPEPEITKPDKRANFILALLKHRNDFFKAKDQRSANLIKLLERTSLDRRILLKEKINVLLKEVVDHSKMNLSPKKKQASNIMDQQKMHRKEVNQQQKKVYNELLAMIQQRVKDEKFLDSDNLTFKSAMVSRDNELDKRIHYVGVSPQEIKFLSLLQLILNSGWSVDLVSLNDMLIVTGVQN